METNHGNWFTTNWTRLFASTFFLAALMSVDYFNLAISKSLRSGPIQLLLLAFIDSVALCYFATSTSWGGWREWLAIFMVFFGVNYLLTAMETMYLGSILPISVALGLIVNGGVVSSLYAAFLVQIFPNATTNDQTNNMRVPIRAKGLAFKIVGGSLLYLMFFMIFGLAVYMPVARFLDPIALSQEQGIVATGSATWVIPIELLRGAVWVVLAVPVVLSLSYNWKRTALIVAILFAVPVSAGLLLSSGMTLGLIVAHFAELFLENVVFGVCVAWILQLRPSTHMS